MRALLDGKFYALPFQSKSTGDLGGTCELLDMNALKVS